MISFSGLSSSDSSNFFHQTCYFYNQEENFLRTNSQRQMHLDVHWSTVYNGQDMEAIKRCIDWWMDKQDMAHYTMHYDSVIGKKNWTNTFPSKMDEPGDDHTKQMESENDTQPIKTQTESQA